MHAFRDAGLVGVLGRSAAPRESRHRPLAASANVPHPPAAVDRLVPVVPLSVPELRRIRAFHWFYHPITPDFFWHWSIWRRYKQALAMRGHYEKLGAGPPDFEYLRL